MKINDQNHFIGTDNPYWKKSYVKDVYIELPNYEYKHKPLDNNDDIFIGREDIEKNFLNMLCNSKTPTGAYLVTGSRGMGKTSLNN